MKKLLLVLAIAGIVAAPGLASAQQLFDFNGQALLPAVSAAMSWRICPWMMRA